MSSKTANVQTALKKRIRQFYGLLNEGEFARCYAMIDPRLREQPQTITLLQYEQSSRRFVEQIGAVLVQKLEILSLHLNEPSQLYEGRDFALGKTHWEDEAGNRHQFSERWVCDGSTWYTRSTGFLKPTLSIPTAALAENSES